VISLLLYHGVIAQDTAKVHQLTKRAEADIETGNTNGAIKLYQDILDLDAGNYQSANILSGLYGHLHQYNEQVTWAKKAIEINPKFALAYISLGNGYGATGDLQNAEDSYRKADQLDPKSPIPPYCLAVIEESSGDTKAAIANYQRSVDRDSLFVSGYCGLAVAYARTGDYASAEKYIDKALAIDPKSAKAQEIKGKISERR
jgi:tetratricopeptide (TPR) repeat protein